METLKQDLVYGLRLLAKNPRFTAVAVLSLAIGIGATTAIFSVTNALLLRPLPYKDADRLVILWNRSPGLNVAQDWFSPGQYLDIKTDNQTFAQVAATIDSSFNLTGQGQPYRVEGARVSSSLFPLLGTQAMMGRVFSPDEDEEGKTDHRDPELWILATAFCRRRGRGRQDAVAKRQFRRDRRRDAARLHLEQGSNADRQQDFQCPDPAVFADGPGEAHRTHERRLQHLWSGCDPV